MSMQRCQNFGSLVNEVILSLSLKHHPTARHCFSLWGHVRTPVVYLFVRILASLDARVISDSLEVEKQKETKQRKVRMRVRSRYTTVDALQKLSFIRSARVTSHLESHDN